MLHNSLLAKRYTLSKLRRKSKNMKFLIDADSPRSLFDILKKYGHDAVHVRDLMGSASDEEILRYANKNSYFIITRDLGFAETFLKKGGFGLLLIRIPYFFTSNRIARVFDEFLDGVDVGRLTGCITVIELGRFRIRRL